MSVEINVLVPAATNLVLVESILQKLNASLNDAFNITLSDGLIFLQPKTLTDVGFHVEIVDWEAPACGWAEFNRIVNETDEKEPKMVVVGKNRVVQVSRGGNSVFMYWWFAAIVNTICAEMDGAVMGEDDVLRPNKPVLLDYMVWRASLAEPSRRYDDICFWEDAKRYGSVPALIPLIEQLKVQIPTT